MPGHIEVEYNDDTKAGLAIQNFNSTAATQINFYNDISTLFQIGISSSNFPFGLGPNTAYLFAENDLSLGTNYAEVIRIKDTGNVGIGKTNPGQKLDVFGASGTRIQAESADDSFAGFLVKNSVQEYFMGVQAASEGPNSWQLYDNTNGARRMVVTPTGNVGIGTNTPATDSKLHVLSDIVVSSNSGVIRGEFAPPTGTFSDQQGDTPAVPRSSSNATASGALEPRQQMTQRDES